MKSFVKYPLAITQTLVVTITLILAVTLNLTLKWRFKLGFRLSLGIRAATRCVPFCAGEACAPAYRLVAARACVFKEGCNVYQAKGCKNVKIQLKTIENLNATYHD